MGDFMKTMSKLVFSAVAALATMGFSAACYAVVESVDLPCCTEGTCPTRFESPGMPGVVQTATFKGVSVFVGGERKLLTTVFGDPGYKEWWTAIRQQFDKETAGTLTYSSRIAVFAQCSSTMATINNLEKTKTLVCPEGDGIFLEQHGPAAKCLDPQTGPHSVVEITKETREEREAEAEKIIQKSQAREYQLLDEIKGFEEQARLERIHLGQLRQQFLGKGLLTTVSGSGSNPY